MLINGFKASVRKTTKVDINKDAHNLPPDCGAFKEFQVSSWFCPDEWSKDGIFIPVTEGEPLWLDFRGNDLCAVIVSVQRINPITGKPANLEEGLKKDPEQNYLVLPNQLWLDGYSKEGKVYQFVITKSGEGLAVNEYLLPVNLQDSHAIGLAFYEPKVKPEKPVVYPNITLDWEYTIPAKKYNWHDWYQDGSATWNSHGSAYGGTSCGKGSNLGPCGQRFGEPMCYSGEIPTKSSSVLRGGQHVNCVKPQSMNCFNILEDNDRMPESVDQASMGAGGRIIQKINQDTNTVEFYKEKPSVIIPIYLALPELFEVIMKKGERQDHTKEDDYVHSGKIGGISVPLV